MTSVLSHWVMYFNIDKLNWLKHVKPYVNFSSWRNVNVSKCNCILPTEMKHLKFTTHLRFYSSILGFNPHTVELQWLEHWWLVNHGCFELVIESLGTKSHSCRLRIILGWFSFFILKMVYCVYSLESPRWGDSNENTQYTFMSKKIEKNYPY